MPLDKNSKHFMGERIKLWRKKKGLTQEELGRRVLELRGRTEKDKAPAQVVSNWERGYSQPLSSDVPYIAQILGVSTDYLHGTTEDPMPYDDNSLSVVDLKKVLENNDDTAHWGGHLLTEEQKQMLKKIILAVIERGEQND